MSNALLHYLVNTSVQKLTTVFQLQRVGDVMGSLIISNHVIANLLTSVLVKGSLKSVSAVMTKMAAHFSSHLVICAIHSAISFLDKFLQSEYYVEHFRKTFRRLTVAGRKMSPALYTARHCLCRINY